MNTAVRPGAGFCYLKDQIPISQDAYQRARHLCEQVRSSIAGRADFLQRTRRSPEVHLPHGNWELGGGLYAAYSTVAEGAYPIVNNLRLFSQIFTGHQLMSLSGREGMPIPRTVPSNLDARLAALAATPGPEVAAYLERIAHLPEPLHITPPNRFGEVGWLVDGKIINHDTNVYLERIALLAECGKLWELRNRSPERTVQPWRRPRILEIGGGYGGLAHHLMSLIPQARYVVVDIPESLLFSSIYLSTLWEEKDNAFITPENLADLGKDTAGLTFVPNFLFDDCCTAGLEFDLIINTLSMSEMTEKQVRYYCKGITRLLGRRGVFFEQNQDNRSLGLLDAKSIFANFFRLGLPVRHPILSLTQGAPHLWADTPVRPFAWTAATAVLQPGLPAPTGPAYWGEEPLLIEEGFFGINVIYYRGTWYGLPQSSGPFIPDRVARRDYPKLFMADSKDKLKKAIRA